MKIVRFAETVHVSFKKSAGGATITFEAMRDYVIATNQLDRICQDKNVHSKLYKVSALEPRLVPFHIMAKKEGSQRLLFFNGSGGYGDQIMSWPIVKWLAMQGYDMHVMTDPGNQPCWYGFPWVKTVNIVPMPFEQFKMYDHHFVMEHVSNLDEHADQLHPVDAMFVKMGIDPGSIDPKLKVVRPMFTGAEVISVNNFKQHKDIGFYQLSSANLVRALTPNDSAFLAVRLAEEFPDTHWFCLFDEFVPKEYPQALECAKCKGTGNSGALPPDEAAKAQVSVCSDCGGSKYLAKNLQPIIFSNLRELWALISNRASIVVSPDSMMVHAAGTMNIPCVGLWGPVAPTNRIAYYSGHHAIWHREACQMSPCFCYASVFPRYCPPRGTARTVCEVMAAVNPHEVVEAVRQIKKPIS